MYTDTLYTIYLTPIGKLCNNLGTCMYEYPAHIIAGYSRPAGALKLRMNSMYVSRTSLSLVQS